MAHYRPRRKCYECGRTFYEDTNKVRQGSRLVGGSYNRAGHNTQVNICTECAHDLLKHITPGHWSVSRWSVHDIQQIAEHYNPNDYPNTES